MCKLSLAELLAERNWGLCTLLVCSPTTCCWLFLSLFHTPLPQGFPDHPESRYNGQKNVSVDEDSLI